MLQVGLKDSKNTRWYEQFGKGLIDIVGTPNMHEAAVIFGITSQQNSAEQNLADTLHIMAVARQVNPENEPEAFAEALKTTRRPNGQKLKITGDQIGRITKLYTEGFSEAGIKTSTYMQLILDAGKNRFNPFSVQDVHMARVFGFRYRGKDPKTGRYVDKAMIPGDLQYQYAQFLTSY